MENKFLAIMIVYIIIASSALAYISGETLMIDTDVNQNITFTDYNNADVAIVGDYAVDSQYGVYSENITIVPYTDFAINPIVIGFPVKYTSDESYYVKFHIHNPNYGTYKIDYNTNLILTYWIEVNGNTLTYHDAFGKKTYDVIYYTDYDIGIDIDNENNKITIILPDREIVETYSSLQLVDLNECTITISDNYVYVSSIQVENDADPSAVETNLFSQLALILLWNVEGLPVALNLIFIKVPLLMVAVASFQLIRGN